jgi:two-component system, NtrC family, sensor kinase
MHKDLQHIITQISRSPDVDNGDLAACNRVILNGIIAGLHTDRASVWLLAEDRSSIQCIYLVDGNSHFPSPDIALNRLDFPHYFAALDGERNIVAVDAHQHHQTSEFSASYLTPLRICSMLDTPIRHHGAMVGIICIEHRQTKQWQPDEIVFAGFLADLYGRALSASERVRYQSELEQLNSRLEQIIDQRTFELTQSLQQLQKTQHRLIEMEKMASLGRLVAGIAHEINTPLGVAVTATSHAQVTINELEHQFQSGQLTRQQFRSSSTTAKNSLELVHANLQRTVDLVNSFKQTAAAGDGYQTEKLQLKQFISQVISSIGSLLKQHQVDMQLEIPDNLQVKSFSSPLATIVTRLIENACQHAFSEHPSPRITISATRNSHNWQLQVADNGRGMTKDELNRAFEPFFTTKRNIGAKGLGLTLVFNLVSHLLQGEINLQNDEQGCVVTLQCPITLSTV